MLRFKVDENLPAEVACLLARQGHDALTVRDQGLAGTSDPELSAICRAETRVLVTLDTGFSNIRAYPPVEHPGIVVLRLEHQDKGAVMAALARMMGLLEAETLSACLWIVEPDRVRIWRSWE